jgi:hypothetical protein
MKSHKYNKSFKHDLELLAHGRGRRPRLETRVIDKDIRKRKNDLRFKDEMDDLEELRRQGVKIG